MLYSLTLPEILCCQLVQKVIPYFFPGDEFLVAEINWKLQYAVMLQDFLLLYLKSPQTLSFLEWKEGYLAWTCVKQQT